VTGPRPPCRDPAPGCGKDFATAAARLAGAAGWVLRWTPEAFWATTPGELAAILATASGHDSAGPVTRSTIETLQERFPDG
jgi:uncharacterized phage protein (TIGR02216 family)